MRTDHRVLTLVAEPGAPARPWDQPGPARPGPGREGGCEARPGGPVDQEGARKRQGHAPRTICQGAWLGPQHGTSPRVSTAVSTGTRPSRPARWASGHDGVVTLRGEVRNAKAKARAVELARETVGITQVIDRARHPAGNAVRTGHLSRPLAWPAMLAWSPIRIGSSRGSEAGPSSTSRGFMLPRVRERACRLPSDPYAPAVTLVRSKPCHAAVPRMAACLLDFRLGSTLPGPARDRRLAGLSARLRLDDGRPRAARRCGVKAGPADRPRAAELRPCEARLGRQGLAELVERLCRELLLCPGPAGSRVEGETTMLRERLVHRDVHGAGHGQAAGVGDGHLEGVGARPVEGHDRVLGGIRAVGTERGARAGRFRRGLPARRPGSPRPRHRRRGPTGWSWCRSRGWVWPRRAGPRSAAGCRCVPP